MFFIFFWVRVMIMCGRRVIVVRLVLDIIMVFLDFFSLVIGKSFFFSDG